MKHFFKLSFMAVVIFLAGCESPKPKTTLAGTIINPKDELIQLKLDDQVWEATLDSMGSFSIEVPIYEATFLSFNHGGEYINLYMKPGMNLELSLDTKAFDETLEYIKGDDDNANKYLVAMVLLRDTLENERASYELGESEFLSVLDTLEQKMLGYLDTLLVSDETFKSEVRVNSKWVKSYQKLTYKYYKEYSDSTFQISEQFLDFQKDLDINDTTNLKYDRFMRYVSIYLMDLQNNTYSQLEDQTYEKYFEVQFETILQEVSSPAIRRPFLYEMIEYSASSLSENLLDRVVTAWKETNPDKKSMESFESIMAVLEKMKPGNQAPEFNYVSYEGDSVSLASLEGKLVYIDVWATWCGPCIKEHPAMEKLQEDFAGKDVEFVAVSIDSSPEPWKKMLEKKKLGGLHLYAPGAWKATIMEDYAIKGIPRFILIDEQGKIINADAPRPSGKIKELLEEHLST